MATVKEALGAYGEGIAVAHLEAAGFVVVDRNWRCPLGELDVVAWDGETLVVVEVKTRRSAAFGGAAEAVTAAKAHRVRSATCRWLVDHRPPYTELRFDVVTVELRAGRPPAVEHVRGAF